MGNWEGLLNITIPGILMILTSSLLVLFDVSNISQQKHLGDYLNYIMVPLAGVLNVGWQQPSMWHSSVLYYCSIMLCF